MSEHNGAMEAAEAAKAERLKLRAEEARTLAALLYEDICKLTDRPTVAWGAVCVLVSHLRHELPAVDAEDQIARIQLMCDALGADMKVLGREDERRDLLRHRGPRVFRRRG